MYKLYLFSCLFIAIAQLSSIEMYVCDEHGQKYGFVEAGTVYKVWEAQDDRLESNEKATCGICGKVNQNRD